ncbi:hypothetical protein [Edaphobacter aggregans]|uniref:hypothetical protein n=1 Tax=Edaphobacter aggregans TaxID=570835 RepID=UPI0012F8542F|nr:hypothetical protein [Edaphobacter aggregans]
MDKDITTSKPFYPEMFSISPHSSKTGILRKFPASYRNRDFSGATKITSDKPTFYEQVTAVKLLFFLHRAFVFVVGLVATHVALHRVSIRTLCELS